MGDYLSYFHPLLVKLELHIFFSIEQNKGATETNRKSTEKLNVSKQYYLQ